MLGTNKTLTLLTRTGLTKRQELLYMSELTPEEQVEIYLDTV